MTNGQDQFSVHIFPFRMTWHNLAQYADSPWVPFWENLKQGYDFFHGHRNPPLVTVTDGRYVFQDFRPFIFGGDLIPAQEAVEKVIVAVETKPSGDKEQKIVEIKPSSAKKYITVAKKSSNDRKIAAIGKKPLKNRSAL
jgi:murein L,D-transpeptidase YafK